MAHHMELVEEDARFGNMLQSAATKGFPHVHDRQVNATGFLDSPLLEKQVPALLGVVLAAKPNGTPPKQVAHDDAVGVPTANGDFINANHLKGRCTHPAQLLPHVLLLQLFDRVRSEEHTSELQSLR